jgi:hypothetical protein
LLPKSLADQDFEVGFVVDDENFKTHRRPNDTTDVEIIPAVWGC